MGDGLHLVFKQANKNFDASYGVLKLPIADSFTVTIKEYEEELKKIEQKRKSENQKIAQQKQDDIKFAEQKWRERAGTPEWSEKKLMENWDANAKIRVQKEKAATDLTEANHAKQIAALNTKFSSINWVWTLAPKQIIASQLDHNESVAKGITEIGKTLHFPKVLEGGGLAYVEAFRSSEFPTGKQPFGMLVQAKGTPKILRVEWTDFNYNSLKGKKVKFGSSVLLHIYTEALYGQDVGIYLWDKDTFSPNDDLKIGKEARFQREVDIHKALAFENKKEGVADTLVKANQPKDDNIVEKEQYVQKIMVEVSVDHAWRLYAGEHLLIFPSIQSNETKAYFEGFDREILEVDYTDGTLYTAPRPITNNPVLVGEVDTNYAAYHPCKYTEILMQYEEKKEMKSIELFKENSGVSQPSDLEVGIIVGSDPKKFNIKVDEKADTKECRFHGKPNDHAKNIFVYDQQTKPNTFTVTNHSPKSIEGNLFFDYQRLDMLKYFWLSNNFGDEKDYPHFKISALSCRYQKFLNLIILPDIEWELAFIITTMPGFRIKADNTTVTRLNQDLGEYQFRGIKAEQSGKLIEKGGIGYSLNMKYSINGGDFYEQISLDFVRNIEKIIDTYNSIVGFAEIFKGDEENVTSVAISQSVINKITFDIDPPAVVFLLKWKYDYAKKNKMPVVNFTGAAGFKPLIGLKIGVDLVANADKFGGLVGAIIKWGAKFVKKLTNLDLYIIVETGVALNYDIGLSYNEIDGFAPNTKQKVVVDLTFSIKAGIKKKEVIFITNVSQMDGNTIPTNEAEQETFKVEGAATTGIRYTEEHGLEKGKGNYKKVDVKWLGAEITITVVTMSHRRKMNAPPNNQFKEKFTVLGPKTIYGPETTYMQNK